MIKIPAAPEGIAAIKQALSEGINVNVTLSSRSPRTAR
jgi:transaldolase